MTRLFQRPEDFMEENRELFEDLAKMEEKEMNVASTGGLRDNKGKPRLALVPSELEEAVAQVIFRSSIEGGGKYPMHNWRRGLPWSEVAESALRHLKKFAQQGQDFDEETGLDHLAHAACNIAFLLWYRKHRTELDDRYRPTSGQGEK